jgi:hypothetical protein
METKMKKVFLLVVLFVLFIAMTIYAAKEPKFNFSVFGVAGYALQSGSASDYKFMENDFCIKKAYLPFGVGLGLGYNLKSFYVGLEGDYNLGGTRKFEDPVEDDTVAVKMQKSLSSYLVLGYKLMHKAKMSLAVQLGGGINLLLGDQGTFTSDKGYRVYVKPRENKTAMAGFLGLAYKNFFSKSLGLTAHLRWDMEFAKVNDENKMVSMPNLGVGLVIAF